MQAGPSLAPTLLLGAGVCCCRGWGCLLASRSTQETPSHTPAGCELVQPTGSHPLHRQVVQDAQQVKNEVLEVAPESSLWLPCLLPLWGEEKGDKN